MASSATADVATAPDLPDPFGTEAIRRRVLDAWAASPARFREDANAEEDYALGGYRDRLVVELAQNAADAASRAGVAGALRLDLDGDVLRAANVGEPLDSAGVQALATLRASAKRDAGSVGRFGVGFAAVLAVTDEPEIRSTSGGVRFSRSATTAAVAELPSLAEELTRRDGHVPALRLPWPASGGPPDGYDTEVWLPIRAGMVAAVRAALAEVEAELLLGLPGLHRLQIGERVITCDWQQDRARLVDAQASRVWRVARADGTIPADLLADRPTEERERDRWSLTLAVPLSAAGTPEPVRGGVLHAPTPSAEPITLPARLIATVPLDPDRRHVAAGPLADFLVERAAAAYAALVAGLPTDPSTLALVPQRQLAGAAFDAALVEASLAELRHTTLLTTVDGVRIAPEAGCVLDGIDPEPFVDVLDGLLPVDWESPQWTSALRAIGVRQIGVTELIDLLSTVDRPAFWWRSVYAALAETPDRDALEGLPVPLVDGRTVTGPRGLLLPDPELPAEALEPLGLRAIDPDAVHPLLERLGAQPATARGVLTDDRIAAQVEDSIDSDDPEPLAEAVLALVAAAGIGVDELPWLAQLALPGEDGEWYPAGEMLLPDGELAAVVDPDGPFGRPDPALLQRFEARTLESVGVLQGFAVLRATDVDPATADLELDAESEWYDAVHDRLPPSDIPPVLVEVVAVRDLELVRADAWLTALRLLGGPRLRAVVLAPTVALLADGRRIEVPSYTQWWLGTHPVLAGQRPDRLGSDADDLAGLYDPAPVDAELAELAGVRTGLADVLTDIEAIPDLLDRLADPSRTVPADALRGIYSRIAVAAREFELEPADFVRVGPALVVPSADAAVLEAPYLLPLLTVPTVPAGGVPDEVAALTGCPLASDLVGAPVVTSTGSSRRWADIPGVELAARRCGDAVPTGEVEVHSGLTVGGVAVRWWAEPSVDHVDGAAGAAALGRALAWRLGRWDRRAAAAEALAQPDRQAELAAEDTCE